MSREDVYMQYYKRLVELRGKERADKFVRKADYNILVIQKEILYTSIYLFVKRNILFLWKYLYYPRYRVFYIIISLLLIVAMLFNFI